MSRQMLCHVLQAHCQALDVTTLKSCDGDSRIFAQELEIFHWKCSPSLTTAGVGNSRIEVYVYWH